MNYVEQGSKNRPHHSARELQIRKEGHHQIWQQEASRGRPGAGAGAPVFRPVSTQRRVQPGPNHGPAGCVSHFKKNTIIC